jgi:hypothetical protein
MVCRAVTTNVATATLLGFPDGWVVTMFAVEPDAKVGGDFFLAGA